MIEIIVPQNKGKSIKDFEPKFDKEIKKFMVE